MRDIPNVLIIEKSRFPASVPVEECERVGKTADNKNAIIRYQRRADVGVVTQIGRFFSDLFNGVTRAKGIVCDKPQLPATLHIRGERFKITGEAGSNKALVAPQTEGEGQARQRAAFSALTIEVHQAPLRKSDPALALKVAEELRDRFEAEGKAADLMAVEHFLELDAQPYVEMTPVRLVRLLQFSDALGRMSGTLKQELGADVLAHVLDRMQHWQDRIAKMEVQGQNGPVPAYPGFRFKSLAEFGARPADTTPRDAAPAQPAPAPEARPSPAARPATAPALPPGPAEALQPPQAPIQAQAQPQLQPQPEVQVQVQVQAQAQAQPRPQARPQPEPQPQAQHRPLPQPPAQPQLQPQPQPQVRTQTQAPVPEPEPVLAPAPLPPPPPPPPPPDIKAAGKGAAPSAGLDTNELASAASRLKPAQTNMPKVEAPKAKDDSAAGILAQVMAQRRINLKEDVNDQQDGNDDEWK